MNALVWLKGREIRFIRGGKRGHPGLAPSQSSGGSRAANGDGAPRKHGLSIAADGQIAKPCRAPVSQDGRFGLAGFPITVTPAATSRVTTLPAPIREPSPM